MIRRLLVFLALGALLLAFIVAIAAFQVLAEDREARSSHEMVLARTTPEESAEVAVVATGKWERLPVGDPLLVRLVARNRGDEEITALRGRASFDRTGAAEALLVPCRAGSPEGALGPGASRSLCASVDPGQQPAERWVLLELSWKQGERADGLTLPLGPITLYRVQAERVPRVVAGTLSLLKDLALPLAVALAGWFFQMTQVDQQRAQQTWNLILPRLQESAERFYFPMWTDVNRLLRESRRRDAGQDVEQMSLSFVLLLCHTRALFVERGMFQLKNRRGEELIEAFAGAYLAFGRKLGEREYWKVMKGVDRFAPMTDLEDRLGSYEANAVSLQHYCDAFRRELDSSDFATLLIVLEVFSVVLVYETTVIYHQWYQEPERYPFDQLVALLLKLEAAEGLVEHLEELRSSLQDYLKSHQPARYLWRRLAS